MDIAHCVKAGFTFRRYGLRMIDLTKQPRELADAFMLVLTAAAIVGLPMIALAMAWALAH